MLGALHYYGLSTVKRDNMTMHSGPVSYRFEDVTRWLYGRCGSHDRLPNLLKLAPDMTTDDFLIALGKLWIGFDFIGCYRDDLLRTVSARAGNVKTTIPLLMDPEERNAYGALPDRVTIYRGCGPKNEKGFSWTLNRDVAAQFPFLTRYAATRPLLLTAPVEKHRIAALKLGRNEEEAIVFGLTRRSWTEEPLAHREAEEASHENRSVLSPRPCKLHSCDRSAENATTACHHCGYPCL